VNNEQVVQKRRIIWQDYAAAFQAALECVNTKQSQDFAIVYVPKALPFLTGVGDPPVQGAHTDPGSAWDDWCGENRRKGLHPAGLYDCCRRGWGVLFVVILFAEWVWQHWDMQRKGGGEVERVHVRAHARESCKSAQQTRERGKNGMGDRRFHSSRIHSSMKKGEIREVGREGGRPCHGRFKAILRNFH